jgi:hypothetical protein
VLLRSIHGEVPSRKSTISMAFMEQILSTRWAIA